MDDQNFNDPNVALDWIQMIESEKARVRESDIYPRLNEWLSRVAPKDVLDIGSGQGICSAHIDLSQRNYTGLEPSSLLVDRAKELYPQADRGFVLGSVYQMPFSDGSFDAAFSVSVWHLLSDIRKASSELARVLKKGGSFLIITANPAAYSLWTAPYTETRQEGSRLDGVTKRSDGTTLSDTLYLHTLAEILSALHSAHLVESKVETFRSKPGGLDQYLCIEGSFRYEST
ncbi:MAG: class I SAM-dependent methyltransferase [Bdellovibrionia bacterium]